VSVGEAAEEAIVVESVKRAAEVGVESIVEVVKEVLPFLDWDDRASVQRLRDLVEEGNKDVVAFIARLLCIVKGALDDVVGIARMLDVDVARDVDETVITEDVDEVDGTQLFIAADPRQTVAYSC
jgi:hypothetical protein